MRRLLLALLLLLPLVALARPDWQTLEHDGLERRYLVERPSEPGLGPWPLVLVLHGGGGNARRQARSDFARLADKGYLVVFPEGLDGHWNDGRTDSVFAGRLGDDVGFLRALLDRLQKQYPVDPTRVYATGVSNGGMMSHRLGLELSDRLAAIAPIVGGIPEEIAGRFPSAHPVSVLIIQGTDDPLVPFGGGEVSVFGSQRGRLVSTERAIELWRAADGCSSQAVRGALPDAADDGCKAERFVWSGQQSEVVLIKVEGGGHTLPGGSQNLPKRLVGKVCLDFDGVDEIARFFARHHR